MRRKSFRIIENPKGLFTVQVKGLFGWRAAEVRDYGWDCYADVTHTTLRAARDQLNRLEQELLWQPKIHDKSIIYVR